MNVKKMYYLSERIYETMNCEEKQSEARKEYWRNLLGETMFNQMYRENINFYGYVNGNEYAVDVYKRQVIYSPSKRLRDAIFQAVLETYQERQKE